MRRPDAPRAGTAPSPSFPSPSSPPRSALSPSSLPSPPPQPVSPDALLAVLAALLAELRGAPAPPPGLDDDLERDLGIDSLARMELALRLEAAFAVRPPEGPVGAARTPRELLRVLQAAPARQAAPAPGARPPPVPRPDALDRPSRATTLIDVLRWHGGRTPARTLLTLVGDDPPAILLSYGELLARATTVAAGLQGKGVEPGDSVALMLPTGMDFFAAFMGTLLAGAVPVPIYPPFRAAQIEDHLRRQALILDNGQATLLLADAGVRPAARLLRALVPSLRETCEVAALLRAGSASFRTVQRSAADVALLQYTSGSTGQPKGVILTHANLLANIRAMGEVLAPTAADVFVSWLPLYHDMGLIGAWLGCLYFGVPLAVMPPQRFLARPAHWLRALHEYGGTLSAAPNFAYEILATKVPDEELAGLDLSRWRIAVNGAEPVQVATLARFAERFGPLGFDARAMMPVYGLAENAVGLSFPPVGRGPRIDAIRRRALHAAGRAEPAAPGEADTMQVVSCGSALPGHALRIVDARGTERPERVEGRVQFRGPSATSGYVRNADATRTLFDGSWLETGDLGYMAGGELYLTSRAKDLIIRAGQHIHPYDLEEAVGSLPGIRKGCVAVFGAADPAGGTERVVVLAETRETEAAARAALRQRIGALALGVLGVPADDVVLADAHGVLKTSSGKIRRAACRALYEQGALGAWQPSVRTQLLRLGLSAAGRRARDGMARIVDALQAAWMWTGFAVGAALVLPALCLPRLDWRKRAARGLARGVLRASGVPVRVGGRAQLAARPAIVVANHASYADWLLLTALLPAQTAFVAKSELKQRRLLGLALMRLGVQFVERGDARQGPEDTRHLTALARAGSTLLFFPEGTLTRAPGLRPFHLGAFMVSAQSGLPVLPVTVCGTRSLLRDGSWWPHRHPVTVQAHPPLLPRGAGWMEALRLRDAARAAIASALDEPVLGASDASPGDVAP